MPLDIIPPPFPVPVPVLPRHLPPGTFFTFDAPLTSSGTPVYLAICASSYSSETTDYVCLSTGKMFSTHCAEKDRRPVFPLPAGSTIIVRESAESLSNLLAERRAGVEPVGEPGEVPF
jgi:hypothetical protein